ncbi:hypothetical protein [Spiroplasma ixodetis]|uniref:Uncharacterized protein n=1 Tax=Spiroplasma ixodetis TaxID=2141 RepID=A0ABN6T0E7_9MOLU|nr:hypothetical protein [Spiroplasma ixodetis]BDT04192.1 hypothetical protein SHM_18380 [Spiroplasma ixodetis]
MDNFYAYIPLILKYIVILPYFLKDSKQVLTSIIQQIFETIILDNDTKVNEENLQQSQEFETFEEKPLQDNENKQESKNWTQFKTDFPNIAQIIKNSKNTGIKILTSLITFFEINDDQLGITERTSPHMYLWRE